MSAISHPFGNFGEPVSCSAGNHSTAADRVLDVLALLLPSLAFLDVTMIGRLSWAEVLLLGCIPVLLFRGPRRIVYSKSIQLTSLLCFLWLLGQLSTDILLSTPFNDYARGWSKIVFTAVNLIGFVLLLQRGRKRMMLFAGGLAMGGLLGYLFNPSVYAEAEPWKFGIGQPITWVIVLASTWCYSRNARLAALILMLLGTVLNIIMGYRSMGGVCFVSTLWLIHRTYRKRNRWRISSLVGLFLMTLLTAAGFLELYQYSALSGLLGDQEKKKVEWQSEGDMGIIAGGRGALMASLLGVWESPVIGHGSWSDGYALSSRASFLLEASGYDVTSRLVARDSQSAHSHLLGAWVEAGILGAVFWTSLLLIACRGLASLYSWREPIKPLVVFACVRLLWDIVFSPYAGEFRIITPFYLALLICISTSHRHQAASPGGTI